MRKRKKEAEKLRVRILQAAKDGLTYEQIHERTGASSSTIARIVKGKDLSRFCTSCGQTDAEKLHEHHPDKLNRPSETVTLCANCHAAITREQQRKRSREKKVDLAIPVSNPVTNIAAPPVTANQPQMRPLTQEQQKWIAKGICYGAAGIAIGKGLSSEKISGWDRLLMLAVGGIFLYGGVKTQ